MQKLDNIILGISVLQSSVGMMEVGNKLQEAINFRSNGIQLSGTAQTAHNQNINPIFYPIPCSLLLLLVAFRVMSRYFFYITTIMENRVQSQVCNCSIFIPLYTIEESQLWSCLVYPLRMLFLAKTILEKTKLKCLVNLQ